MRSLQGEIAQISNIAACYLDCLTPMPNERRAFTSMNLKLRTS